MAFEREPFNDHVQSKLDILESIWQSVGIDPEQRKDRARTAMSHVTDLLDEMIEEEQSLKQRIQDKITTHQASLLNLCTELSLASYEPASGQTMISLEKDLRLKHTELCTKKSERMMRLEELRKTDQYLCDMLQMTPFYIPSGSVPSHEQLGELKKHVTALETEKCNRNVQYQETRSQIVSLMEKLERYANSSFEKDVLCEEEDSFLLSTQNMKSLKELHNELEEEQHSNKLMAKRLRDGIKTLWERLQIDQSEREVFCATNVDDKPSTLKVLQEEIRRCEEMKAANIKQVIEGARRQLHEWWDKCFFTQDQRNVFTPLNSEEFTEGLLAQHDQELHEVKVYYNQSAELFDRVARWKVLWEAFIEFEKKANNPDRFFNRGCNLLKEEKARKKLMRELPRVEQELTGEIETWEKNNRRTFAVGGERFIDFIKKQWGVYHANKEVEKKQRLRAKAKETEEEMIYGSKRVITPLKRRVGGTTPGKTPTNKVRKLSITPKTPASVSRLGNRTNHLSHFPSPAMLTRSTGSKSKTPNTHRSNQLGRSRLKKVLSDKNTNVTTNDSLFSQTAVSGGTSTTFSNSSTSSTSIASVGPYNDFAVCLNQQTRSQCRSSVAPRPMYF